MNNPVEIEKKIFLEMEKTCNRKIFYGTIFKGFLFPGVIKNDSRGLGELIIMMIAIF